MVRVVIPKPNRAHESADQRQITAPGHPCRLLSTPQLAELLGVSEMWLHKAHMDGTGPVATRIGRRRLYHPDDVQSWLATKKQRSTSDKFDACG
jgi:predicted DNA-binding transcriptional regulator AlpA